MKKLATALGLFISTALIAHGDINWAGYPTVGSGGGLWDQNGIGHTELTGNNDSSIGFFVQLIEAGGNSVADLASSASLQGVTGDDTVVDTTWVGQGFSGIDGGFNNQGYTFDPILEQNFFLRVWNSASPNFAGGEIPSGAGIFYGDSNIRNVDLDPDGAGGDPPAPTPLVDFTLLAQGAGQGASDGIATTTALLAVPEPGTLVLLAGGLFAMWLRRRTMNV